MGIFHVNVEETVEQTITGMHDEVIVRIVKKLGGAIGMQFREHVRALTMAIPAFFGLYVCFKYTMQLTEYVRSEWEWEKKCNLSLVSAQLWVPLTAKEVPAPQDFHVPVKSPSKGRLSSKDSGGTSSMSTSMSTTRLLRASTVGIYGSEGSEQTPTPHPSQDESVSSKSRVAGGSDEHPASCPDLDATGSRSVRFHAHEDTLSPRPLSGFPSDDDGEDDDDSGNTIISGVAKRTLFQRDIWKIGVLRDKRMHRAVITAAEKTTPDNPFVTDFLDERDTWYVLNALVNELSSMCAMGHLEAMNNRELYCDSDAYVIALMVPRSRQDVKRQFMGEEFCASSTSITKMRVIVVKERDIMKMATKQLKLQSHVPGRFQNRWSLLDKVADKYRRFEACRILRHAIRQVEGELAGASHWEAHRTATHTLPHQTSANLLEDRAVCDDRPATCPVDSTPVAGGCSISSSWSRHFGVRSGTIAMGSSRRSYDKRENLLAQRQRVREISRDQFLAAGEDLDIPRGATGSLFDVLDVNGDGLLSVDEVDKQNREKGHAHKASRNYISMHLQRVFLPIFHRKLFDQCETFTG